MNDNYQKHYGFARIRKSLKHFFVGKGFRLASTVAVIILLARLLEPAAYAAYIAFQAVIGVLEIITTFGIQRALYRYLPELRSLGNHITTYRFLAWGMLLRTVLVLPLFAITAFFTTEIASALNIAAFASLLSWYLLVGYIRSSAGWLAQCMESLLWQQISQYTMALGGMVTLVALALFAALNQLNLTNVILSEAVGATLSLVTLLYFWFVRWRRDPDRAVGDTSWWSNNRSRVIRFAAWGFVLKQSQLLYGSSPNRLLLAYFLPNDQLAAFGLADHFKRLAAKFMPANTFQSMVRPIAMARYAATQDFREVARMTDLTYRLNLLILIPPIVVLLVVGEPIFEWITANKYGAAGPLLAGVLILMIVEGTRSIVELLVTALEKNSIFFWTNLVQSASLVLAIPLIPSLGAWSVIVANGVGTVLSNVIIITRIRRQGYNFHISKWQILLIALYGAISAVVGVVSWRWSGSFILATVLIVLSYVGACVVRPPFLPAELKFFRSLLYGRGKKRGERADKGDDGL